MNIKSLSPFIIVLAVIAIFVMNSAYIVSETEQVIITQFGEPMGDPVKDPGLHFKTPFIQHANYFEKRVLRWDGYPTEIPTKDKKFIFVDTTARWKITDPLRFLQSVTDETNAQSRLDDIIDGIVRDAVTSHNLVEIVRNSNRILDVAKTSDDIESGDVDRIERGRQWISRTILEKAKKRVEAFGIELIDVRIKRVNYIDSVRRKVFERMISERKRAAEKLRSEGQGIKAEIIGQKQKELKRIRSEAYRTAQEIKGKSDATAIKIYADAYSKDPEFYSFTNTLDTYTVTLKENSTLILNTDNDYLKYLKKIGKNA